MLASSSCSSTRLQAFRTVTCPKRHRIFLQSSSQCRCHCSLTGFREVSMTQPRTFQNDAVQLPITKTNNLNNNNNKTSGEGKKNGIPKGEEDDDNEEEEEEGKGISKIRVPRQKYIQVSKADLLSGILSNIFRASAVDYQDDDEVKDFLLLSS